MKVLAKGRPQKEWSIERICTGAGNDGGGCGAKLLVGKSDLFTTASSSYDGSSEIYVTFQCPECKVLTDTNDSRIDRFIRELPSKQTWTARHNKADNEVK